jgi:hypothetical protein
VPAFARRFARIIVAAGLATIVALPGAAVAAEPTASPAPTAGPGSPIVEARVMLEGHARVGSWMAIDVRIRNDGPPIVGELRLAGGAQGRTRFATPVDLPTTSDKHYRLYAQPPAFGNRLDVVLVAGGRTVTSVQATFTIHDASQLVVGIVAERAQALVGSIDLPPTQNGVAAALVPLEPADLPDRVEAWAAMDRLIWQDVDSTQLTPQQIAALRGWLAAGGRLVVVGGTANPSVLSAFPDDLLPFRPEATIDVPPAALADLLGGLPGGAAGAADLPGLSGDLVRGRALSSVGDRAVAAETTYGSGAVAIIGIDPTTAWIADSVGARAGLWRDLVPARTTGLTVGPDDNQLINAVSQLPALALPPIGGLLALLAGYIVLIGPANYLVLRRIDRREWAWITMPILIAVFAVGAYGFGVSLRGLDVIVNEVAIVRGSPGATEGTAQVYLGVFSPSRGTYELEVPSGALLASTLTGDFATGGEGAALDVVQGTPARVRNLTFGFTPLRTLRAETPTTVPRVEADLILAGGTLSGTVVNRSEVTLERPAVVLGGSVVVLGDLEPGEEGRVSLPIRPNSFGQSIADKIMGPLFFGDPARGDDSARRDTARHYVLDQLTYDPNVGSLGTLPSESPVLLAWGNEEIVDVRVDGQVPRRTGNVLYYLPLELGFEGAVAFESDLVRVEVIDVDALFFNKDPYSMHVASGSVTVGYRPIAFDGRLEPSTVVLSLGFGGEAGLGDGPLVPLVPTGEAEPDPAPAPDEPPCDPNTEDCFGRQGLPDVAVRDQTDGSWRALPRLSANTLYELADPARYLDPATGTLLVRFANDRQEGATFTFQVRIEGQIR